MAKTTKTQTPRPRRRRKFSFVRWFYAIFTASFTLVIAYAVQLQEDLYLAEKKIKELKDERSEIYTKMQDLREKNIALESEMKGYFKYKQHNQVARPQMQQRVQVRPQIKK